MTIAATRVTHSRHLIEIGGRTILTDPWFSQREHYHQGELIALGVDDLPALDAVVITHAHDDHCDLDAFRSYRDLAVPLVVAESVVPAAREAGLTDVRGRAAGRSADGAAAPAARRPAPLRVHERPRRRHDDHAERPGPAAVRGRGAGTRPEHPGPRHGAGRTDRAVTAPSAHDGGTATEPDRAGAAMTASDITEVPLTVRRQGGGRPVLVLHGGGGPASVAAIVDHLAPGFDVLAPTIPGWDGTERPDWFRSIDDVAFAFVDLLRRESLEDVVVVGSSIGGWIGAAMAGLDADRARIARLALVDAVGVEVPGEPIRDFFALDARGIAEYSFHDGERFFVDPATVPAEQQARQRGNMTTMRAFARDPYMHDPALLHRLGRITVPVLGIWGESDRIVTPEYGRRYLSAFPHSSFEVVARAGHLPHIERPDATFALLDPFVRAA